MYVICPLILQVKEDLQWFYDLDAAIEQSKDRPSLVKVVGPEEFNNPTDKTIIDALSTHSAVVAKAERPVDKGFLKSTLAQFCNIHSLTTIHGKFLLSYDM